jgi:GDPmannose 4,6-dehydratase
MLNKKVAFLTGITGQDGSYLAELLLDKGYEVHGMIRRSSTINTKRIDHIYDSIKLHYGDMTDSLCLDRLLHDIQPDEIYHLAAQSHVKVSFELPEYTGEVDALGTLKLIESYRRNCPNAKLYNACTSELYGLVQEVPQNENTPFYPRSPYGIAKQYSFWICKNYREAYSLKISNGILFNHESERRGETFVTRKITLALSKIKNSIDNDRFFNTLKLGNLYSKRDWGYAKDYVYGMWQMLQEEVADDYVIATGETHTIKEFINLALVECGIEVDWIGEGVDEKAVTKIGRNVIVEIDENYFRPTEVDLLIGDYSKIKNKIGWEPTVRFEELVKIMMKSDIKNIMKNYE